MNKEYIINKIKPYLNSKGMLGEADFNKLFSRLSNTQQYDIINLLIDENIDIDYDNVSIGAQNIPIKPVRTSLNIPGINKLSNEQLCVIYQQGNKSALEALVRNNSRLVWSRALKYNRRYKHKLDEEDLVQCGNIGLIKAAEKFDLKKEAKFTTYATWWIDQQILRSIADCGFTIRIPVHYFDQVNNLMKIISQNPDCSKQQLIELAEEKGIGSEKFDEILMITENIISLTSLNVCVGDDEESELVDFKVDDISPSVEEQVENSLLKETISSILSTLTVKQQDVIEQRFGLKDDAAKTLEQLGIKYEVTRERIRQIEEKAIDRLRRPAIMKKLAGFL